MNEEIWKGIKGYEGKYAISNLGRVKSLNYRRTGKEKILHPCNNMHGYLQIILWKGGKYKPYKVHRLVLSTFNPVENMENLDCNHLDEDKTNNNLNNLEWCTRSYNNNYGTHNTRMAEKLRGRTHTEESRRKVSIPIVQIDPSTNNAVDVFWSSVDAQREGGFNNSNINKCCKGKLKTHKGYKWQYLHVYISQIDPRIKKVVLFGKEYEF